MAQHVAGVKLTSRLTNALNVLPCCNIDGVTIHNSTLRPRPSSAKSLQVHAQILKPLITYHIPPRSCAPAAGRQLRSPTPVDCRVAARKQHSLYHVHSHAWSSITALSRAPAKRPCKKSTTTSARCSISTMVNTSRPLIVGPESGPEAPFPLQMEGKVIKGFGRGSKEVSEPFCHLLFLSRYICPLYFSQTMSSLLPNLAPLTTTVAPHVCHVACHTRRHVLAALFDQPRMVGDQGEERPPGPR